MKQLLRLLIGTTLVMTALGTTGLRTLHAETGGGSYTCTGFLVGAVVPGNVVIPSGSYCIISGATIEGNVIVQPGGKLDIQRSTVERNVLSQRADGVFVGQDQILGNVELKGGTRSTRVLHTSIGGQANLSGNSGTTILDFDTIAKHAHFTNNTGLRNEVAFNTVAGMLQCESNTPPPSQVANVAQRYQGQCAVGA